MIKKSLILMILCLQCVNVYAVNRQKSNPKSTIESSAHTKIIVSNEKAFKKLNIDIQSFSNYLYTAQELTNVLSTVLEKNILVEFSAHVYNKKDKDCLKIKNCTEMEVSFNAEGLLQQMQNSPLSLEQAKFIILSFTNEIIAMDNLQAKNYKSKAKVDIIFRIKGNVELDDNQPFISEEELMRT